MEGNFNGYLANPEGRECVEGIVVALAIDGLEDTIDHLLPRRKPWLRDGRTLIMRRVDSVVGSQTNYLLGLDLRMYQNI